MGADASVELSKPFDEISKWPKNRVESAIKAYYEGEYDFGIDTNVVMSITGYEADEAKELLAAHSKNDSGIINAITLLITIIALGNSENRNEASRLESLFDLLDFNRAGKISFDEMTILLLCIGSSFSFIINGHGTEESGREMESSIMLFSKAIHESLNKRSNSSVSKDEFCRWVKQNLFSKGVIHINDILRVIATASEDGDEEEENTAEKQKGKK